MGNKKAKKSGAKGHVCAECRNFKARKGSKGYCKRKEKKRRPDDEGCGHFDAA
jgi:hypothetical protein